MHELRFQYNSRDQDELPFLVFIDQQSIIFINNIKRNILNNNMIFMEDAKASRELYHVLYLLYNLI
jgi:hypothetical protein